MNESRIGSNRESRIESNRESRDYCTIKRMSLICHGQQFDWKLLKMTGAEMEMLPIFVFDQIHGTVKAYYKDVWLEAYALTF